MSLFYSFSMKTTRMKPLKPSKRENKRYLLIVGKDLRKNIEKAIMDFVGSKGFGDSGLKFIETNSGKTIVAINREALNLVRASFAVFSEVINIKKVSGTLKGLRNK